MDNPIINKLKKLIALSASDNQHEAEQALKLAQKIALMHNIELAQIDQGNNTQEDMMCLAHNEGKRLKITQSYVNWILQNHFQIQIITTGNRMVGRILNFIGRPDKVEYAKWLNNYLNETFLRLWHKRKSEFNDNLKNRETYFYGLFKGLDEKLTENKKILETEMLTNENINNYGILIVNESQLLTQSLNKFFPKIIWSSKSIAIKSNSALNAGISDGNNISLERGLDFVQVNHHLD